MCLFSKELLVSRLYINAPSQIHTHAHTPVHTHTWPASQCYCTLTGTPQHSALLTSAAEKNMRMCKWRTQLYLRYPQITCKARMFKLVWRVFVGNIAPPFDCFIWCVFEENTRFHCRSFWLALCSYQMLCSYSNLNFVIFPIKAAIFKKWATILSLGPQISMSFHLFCS